MTGDRFVMLPSERMFEMLAKAGFTRVEGRSRREVVYERAHARDPRFKVLVYTSIGVGRAIARARGADAIRVCAIFEEAPGRGRGVAKLPKVLRTAPPGDAEARINHVLERVLGRMREAYAKCNERMNGGR